LHEVKQVYGIAALRRWEQFNLGWVEAWPSDTPIQSGEVVAVMGRAVGVWWLNACRVVYSVDESAFLSEKARLIFFGVHKDAATLKEILDPATFAGTVVSDDAAVYANFTKSQKCWAHLLRKAFKLTLQDQNNPEYRRFADRRSNGTRRGGSPRRC